MRQSRGEAPGGSVVNGPIRYAVLPNWLVLGQMNPINTPEYFCECK